MVDEKKDLYFGREQTLVKHFILRRYLERFAHIVAKGFDTITYVDCFAGPWETRSSELTDTSFSIAIDELKKAQQHWREIDGRQIKLRCFFIEKDPAAYARLKEFCDKQTGVEIETFNGELESSVGAIVNFVRAGKGKNIPFIFVDPTGWTGFGMKAITPLLQLSPGEVLINFMTSHIRRFIEHEQSAEGFNDLFGLTDVPSMIEGLSGEDRDETLVKLYSENVARTGQFSFSMPAIVLEPNENRTHFHLIYCTRNPKGIEVFKNTEKSAMEQMEKARAAAYQRKREGAGQTFFFADEEMHNPAHYDSLRERYMSKAHRSIETLLRSRRTVPYDDAWLETMRFQLTWESDLKVWISEWQKAGKLALTGLRGKERVPKRDVGVMLNWL